MVLVLYLELLEFRKQISFRISLRIEKASFFFTIESSPLGEIVLYPFFGKTYLISFKLIKSVLFYLFVLLFNILYSVFNEHI